MATAVVGIASAAFAVSLAANSLIRARAGARLAAAQLVAARVALLAVRSCAAGDTSGVAAGATATESWTAHRSGAGWSYIDSIVVPPTFGVRASGVVACRH